MQLDSEFLDPTMAIPRQIRATVAVWGAGPGMEGKSYIEFRLRNDIYQVFSGGDAGDLAREQIGEVPVDGGWRARLGFLVSEAEPCHEGHMPSDVIVRGATQPEKALLALAWSGPEGAAVVRILLALDDGELNALARGGFLTDEVADALNGIDELAEEDVLAVVRGVLSKSEFDWRTVVANGQEKAQVQTAFAEAETERVRLELAPHHDCITALVWSWQSLQPPYSGQATGWLASAKRGAVQKFLENSFLANGQPPVGVHRLHLKFMGHSSIVELDMAAVRSVASA